MSQTEETPTVENPEVVGVEEQENVGNVENGENNVQSEDETPEEPVIKEDPQAKAAVKIQKIFRGYAVRKKHDEEEQEEPLPEMSDGDYQQTLAIIKPNAFEHSVEIKRIIEKAGFGIVQERVLHLSKLHAEQFYEEHRDKPFFQKLVGFMTSGNIRVMVLSRKGAIANWRKLIGPTNPVLAKQQSPTSIRAIYGSQTDNTLNAVHGSDSISSSQREICFFFPNRTKIFF